MAAVAALGVDGRTSDASVVTHAEARQQVSTPGVSPLPARCRWADAQPTLIAISAASSGDSAWRDRIDLSMLITLQPGLES